MIDLLTDFRMQRTFAVQSQRPQIGQWLDRFGETYSKCVLVATFAALAGLPLLGVPLHSTPTQVGRFFFFFFGQVLFFLFLGGGGVKEEKVTRDSCSGL